MTAKFLDLHNNQTPPVYKYFVDGEWQHSKTDKHLEIISPVDESIVGIVPSVTKEEAESAVEAARNSQKDWENIGFYNSLADKFIMYGFVTSKFFNIFLPKGILVLPSFFRTNNLGSGFLNNFYDLVNFLLKLLFFRKWCNKKDFHSSTKSNIGLFVLQEIWYVFIFNLYNFINSEILNIILKL
jgi:hypothetical protein